MGKRREPKDLTIPKETVLLRRKQRKLIRQMRPKRPIKNKNDKFLNKKTIVEYSIKCPLVRKDYYEHNIVQNDNTSESLCLFRINKSKKCETFKFAIKKITYQHLNYFFTKYQKQQSQIKNVLLAIKLFPNVKEQSESVAAIMAYKKYLKKYDNTIVFVVGDGVTPRTGFLFALETNIKHVISIDPIMHDEWVEAEDSLPMNLVAYKCKIEDLNLELFDWNCFDHVVVVAVHAHVSFEMYLDCILQKKPSATVIAIPCCVPLKATHPDLTLIDTYQDYNILSPDRTVRIWQTI